MRTKKFAVMEQVSNYSPMVFRMFEDEQQARDFCALCEISKKYDFMHYYVYAMIEDC